MVLIIYMFGKASSGLYPSAAHVQLMLSHLGICWTKTYICREGNN